MRLVVHDRGDVVVVQVQGRITVGDDLQSLREGLEGALQRATPRVVLDLEEVLFIDSAALGEIVAGHRRASEAGGQLVIARPRGKVRDLLDLARVDRLVRIYADLDDALAART